MNRISTWTICMNELHGHRKNKKDQNIFYRRVKGQILFSFKGSITKSRVTSKKYLGKK